VNFGTQAQGIYIICLPTFSILLHHLCTNCWLIEQKHNDTYRAQLDNISEGRQMAENWHIQRIICLLVTWFGLVVVTVVPSSWFSCFD